ncbi:MAG: phosphatidylserine decarboxylase [Acidobacteriota bacterium]|nr:phosphatidylserine decarboxylase [Acidobacteriota bacterium]
MRFAREAWPFVTPPLLGAAVLWLVGAQPAAGFAALVAVAILLFFRDPADRRETPGPGELLSPAYGKVLRVEPAEDSEVAEGPLVRVVTFLSVFDVHLQRVPADGLVVTSRQKSGLKLAAFRPDAGERNEQHLTVVQLANDDRIGVRQIVGLVARRIVCHVEAGDEVQQGGTLGLIKFGSRVDLLVPAHYEVKVSAGDRLRGGVSVVARAPQQQ